MKYKVGDKVKFVKDCTLGTGEVIIPDNSTWTVREVRESHYLLERTDEHLVAMVGHSLVDDYCERINTEPSITKRINNKHDILNGLFNSDGSVDGEKLMKKLDSQNDSVNHPSHYTDGKIEVIDFIEDKKLGYHLGNACKYICRAGKKDPAKRVEDLRKAIWYVNRQAEIWEREQE